MASQNDIDPAIERIARELALRVTQSGFPIERIILFGSYAKHTDGAWSDIDLCLVSSKFGKDSIEELQFLLKQSRHVDDRIEPFPASPEDLMSASPLMHEIQKYGREISLT